MLLRRISSWSALVMLDVATMVALADTGVAAGDTSTNAARAALIQQLARQPGVSMVAQLDCSPVRRDWLIHNVDRSVECQMAPAADQQTALLMLTNGLVSRTFYVADNLSCISFRNEYSGDEFIRAIKPEARMRIADQEYAIGGLGGQPVNNYLDPAWLQQLQLDPNAFVFSGITTGKPQAAFHWQPRYGAPRVDWPPRGLHISMHYRAPATAPQLKDLATTVHYELYEGLPIVTKWVSFENRGDAGVTVERLNVEELAVVDGLAQRTFAECEYAFFRNLPVRWNYDAEFSTDSGPTFTERMSGEMLRHWNPQELDQGYQNSGYGWGGEYHSRSLLTVNYPVGPAKKIEPGEAWRSFKVWEIPQDSADPERQGLARRQLFRHLMPWTQENPAYMHVRNGDSASIRAAVDQCAEVGFEMVILTFGSGYDMMSGDVAYRERIKADVDYAHAKGIKVGGYILFCSSRSYGDGRHDAKSAGGRNLCLGSEFSDEYFHRLLDFIDQTGVDVIETDGPYHGYPCHSTEHKYHHGLDDSYRVNWEKQAEFYRACVDRGLYINSPDWYFATGSHKTPMGYKETNWSLPREYQVLIARQNIYDGTRWRTPSMGWMFVPLVQYHGGGPAATLEPLSEHLDAYEAHLAQNFGLGIMAAYRGPRLYDTDETKAVVKKWVDFYKRHRDILGSRVIHVRRPDGRDLDCMLHANPQLATKGLAFIWNPTGSAIQRHFRLPLYFTGLTDSALVRDPAGNANSYQLDREYNVDMPVTVPAKGLTWFTIETP